jgi:hypothetical protein
LPRAGTIATGSECHFAIVKKDSYERLLKKVETEKNKNMTKFLKQIPYIEDWTIREVSGLRYLVKYDRFINRGTIVVREGTPLSKVFIVKEGEFEIVKLDLTNVFYNKSCGNIAIMESDKKTLVKSRYMPKGNVDDPIDYSKNKVYAYQGTDFQQSI